MRYLPAILLAATVLSAFADAIAPAQDLAPQILPPPPPPPPPPKIEVPAIPRMDAAPPPPRALQSQTQSKSFGERIERCLEEAAAANLGPNERAAYSRACAQR